MDTIPKRRSLSDFCDFFKYFCTRLVFGCFTDVSLKFSSYWTFYYLFHFYFLQTLCTSPDLTKESLCD